MVRYHTSHDGVWYQSWYMISLKFTAYNDCRNFQQALEEKVGDGVARKKGEAFCKYLGNGNITTVHAVCIRIHD